jgi:hypothetical protein
MINERILGVIRFVDSVTRLPVNTPLHVRAIGMRAHGASETTTERQIDVKWTRTRSGAYALRAIPGLDGADPAVLAATPGAFDLDITVHDASGGYLPRRRTIRLPRDPALELADDDPPELPSDLDPDQEDTPGSLFHPIDVLLFPAPGMQVSPGWAAVRATIVGSSPTTRLAGALVRVVREDEDDTTHLGNGLSDERGEALVAVTGIPATSFNGDDGPVMSPGADVTLEIVFDPNAATPPDPFDLERRRASLLVRTRSLRLVPGRVLEETL